MSRSSPERRAPAPQEADEILRKNIDAKTKRVIRQTRGPGAEKAMERVSVLGEDGKERFVSMSREDLKKAEARADKDFERAINAVTAGEELDKKAVAELMGSNKEQILTLARKEADVHGAVYKVMEDAVDAYKEYDKLVDKAVKESGYTGIVADSLRDSLQSERGRVFAEAFSSSAGPRAKRNLENAVRGKILAESANRIKNLNETLGTPAETLAESTSEIRAQIAKLEAMKYGAESNKLERQIQEQTTDWAREYLRLNPDATPKDVMREAKSAGLDEHITGKDVGRIKDGMSKEELYQQPIVDVIKPGAVKKGAAMKTERAIVDDGSYDARLGTSKADRALTDADARADKTIARKGRQAEAAQIAGIVETDSPNVVRSYAEAPAMDGGVMDDGSYDKRLGLSKADKARAEADARTEQMVARRGKTKEADRPMRMDEYDVPKYMGSERASAEDEDPEVIDVTGDIRKEIARIDSITDPEEMSTLDRKIQKQTAEWAKDYLFSNPKASAKEVMAQAATEGFDEYITEKDVKALKEGRSIDQLYQSDGSRLMEGDALDRQVDASLPTPAEYGSDEWLAEGVRAQADEIPDLTDDLEDDEPGFLQKIGSSGLGKWMKRGMLALGLLGAGGTVREMSNQMEPAFSDVMSMNEKATESNKELIIDQATKEGYFTANEAEKMRDLPFLQVEAEVAKALMRGKSSVESSRVSPALSGADSAAERLAEENRRIMAEPMPEGKVTTPSIDDIEAEEYLPTKAEKASRAARPSAETSSALEEYATPAEALKGKRELMKAIRESGRTDLAAKAESAAESRLTASQSAEWKAAFQRLPRAEQQSIITNLADQENMSKLEDTFKRWAQEE